MPRSNKHNNTKINVKSRSATLSQVTIPENSYIEAFMGVPEEDVNPRGTPLLLATVKHSKLVQLSDSGRFAIHPKLGVQDSISIETVPTEYTESNANIEWSFSLNGRRRAFVPSQSENNDNDFDGPWSAEFLQGANTYRLIAPLTVSDDPVSVTDITIGGVVHRNYFPVTVTGTHNVGARTVAMRLSRALKTGESFSVQQRYLMDSGNHVDSIASTPNGDGEIFLNQDPLRDGVVGICLEVKASLASPVVLTAGGDTNFHLEVYRSGGSSLTMEWTSRLERLGLTDRDWVNIHGVISTGRLTLLGMQFWFEWSGTMQQNGTLVTLSMPAVSTGQQLLSRDEIVSLQSSPLNAYNGPLPVGVIGFLKPLDIATYGHPTSLGDAASWSSVYGAYTALSTAADGGALPYINIKYQYVFGYYPDNIFVSPSVKPYSALDLQSAFTMMSAFAALHPNHDHVKTIKKALKTASNAVGAGAKYAVKAAPVAAKVAALLSAAL